MRRLAHLLLLSILLLLGILVGPWRGGEPADDDIASPEIETATTEGDMRDVLGTPDASATAVGTTSDREEVAPVAEALTEEATAKCVVFGVVVDEAGAPLQGVAVRLQAYKQWAEGVDVPRLEGRYDMRGFEVATDVDGAFRFDVLPPTAARTSLEVRPDRFHDSHRIWFGKGNNRARPTLTAGVRNLGEIRLATTGAVRGRVTDAHGQPIADVKMDVGPGRSTTYSRGARTGADGTYLIAHAPVGTYAVKAKAEGYLSGYLEPVTVDARRDTTGVDFTLLAAPSIQGIVVDEQGQPIEGAKLWGWPSSSGSGAGAESKADGSFVVFLPQDEPYSMGVKRDGYQSWGAEHDRSVTFPPGTTDLVVTLVSLPPIRFVVVDAESGEPIERFGLNILEENGSRSSTHVYTERRPPQSIAHPGGIAEATARVGADLFVIAADGYLLATGDVELDEEGGGTQTVQLIRGKVVRGRVLRDGVAVVGANIKIEAGYDPGTGAFRVSPNSMHSTTTDEDGRFELIGLSSVTQRLTVDPVEGAPLIHMIQRITGPEPHDVGDLILLPGARISGEVLLPPGVDPAGLQVRLGERSDGVQTLVDGQGRFHFEDVASGSHHLTLLGRPGVLASCDPVPVELTPSETASITLDARDRSMCAVELVIDLDDLTVAGCQVDLVATDEGGERETLGNCDERGVVSGSVRAWGEASVRVFLRGSGTVEHPDVRLDLQPQMKLSRTVRFEFARLQLQLPAGVALPEEGRSHVQLTAVDSGLASQFRSLKFVGGTVSDARAGHAEATSGTLSFGGLVAGRYTLTLELTDASTEMVETPLPNGGIRIERLPSYRMTREIVLVAGEELSLLLE